MRFLRALGARFGRPAWLRGRRGGLMLLAIGLVVAVGLWWMFRQGSPQPFFLPICVTSYDSPALIAPATSRHDHERLCARFDRVGASTWHSPRRETMLRQLDDLAGLDASEELVVYLSGHAIVAGDDLHLLPADAVPEDPRTWVPLQEVLRRLHRCPARHQLLVLDMMHDGLFERCGTPPGEAARVVPASLTAVPDERRLVLTACAPGQIAYRADILGRSILAFYVEEGLAGKADGCGLGGNRDGEVSVHELAAFVQARVDRWARHNRGAAQTPQLLGKGHDFALASAHGPVVSAAPRRDPPPAWLEQARADCERLLTDGAFRRSPRAWRKMQCLIEDTERALAAGAEPDRLQATFLKVCDRLNEQFPATTLPASFSLALERTGQAEIQQPLHDSLVEAQEQWREAKADEIERAQARFLANWPVTTRHIGPEDRDAAVVSWLTRHTPQDPASIRFADALLRTGGDSEPRYGETLTIRLLADLAYRIPAQAWSNTLAQQALSLARLAEQPLRYPETFALFRSDLEACWQAKHEADIAFCSQGYVPRERAAELLAAAERRLLDLNEHVTSVAKAWELADRASVILPAYRAMFDAYPDRQSAWDEAVALTTRLLQARTAAPDTAGRAQAIAQVERDAKALGACLGTLREPFASERIKRLVQQAQASDAGPTLLQQMEGRCDAGAGWLTASDRQALAKAADALATRLHESVRRLDEEDDALGRCNAASVVAVKPITRASLAVRRVDEEIALLRLGGVSEESLQALRGARAKLPPDGSDSPAWDVWGQTLRGFHAFSIPEQMARETSWLAKDRLCRVLPPREPCPACDTASSPALRVRRQQIHDAWAWLSSRYRYQGRDYQGLGLDTPGIRAAQRFYADAASAHAALPVDAHLSMRPAAPVAPLHAGHVSAESTLIVERFVPDGRSAASQVRVVVPDGAWLEATPDAVELPAITTGGPPRTFTSQVPIRIALRESAERSQVPAPLGLLATAQCEGKTYHRLVAVPLQVKAEEIEIQLSSNPTRPEPSLDELRLRPGNVRQSFFVYLRNLTPRQRVVNVELHAAGSVVPGGRTKLTLVPGQLERLRFHDSPGTLDARLLPDIQGPFEVRVLDADKVQVGPSGTASALLAARRFEVHVLEPHEYIRIADTQVEPVPLAPAGKVFVSLQTWAKVPGPGIPAQLVVPTRRFADLPTVSPQRELAPTDQSPPVALSADADVAAAGDEDSPIYLTVDGVPRAFVFRTALGARTITPPKRDERLAVRIRAAASMQPAERMPVTVEVDNAPPGARLELTVAHPDGGVELVRRYGSAQQRRVGFTPLGPDGALVFEAAIRDWTVSLDTGTWQGQRILKARILDQSGRELQHSLHELIMDATPPEDVNFVAPPMQAQRGTMLKLIAHGIDRDCDIDRVVFFLGQPAHEAPPSGAATVAGFAADPDHGLWAGSIPLPPDQRGSITVGVQFINRAGLSRCATTTVELIDVDPATLRPGIVAGKVFEGPRPQPGLTVILRDEQGRDKLRTRTQPDGFFQFEPIAPGKYQLFCVKPESGSGVLQNVTITPGETKRINLPLSL